MTTRAEHLQWCKDRALEYVEIGDNQQAFASMISDLRKHDDTEASAKMGGELGMMLMLSGNLSTPKQMTDFINGFN